MTGRTGGAGVRAETSTACTAADIAELYDWAEVDARTGPGARPRGRGGPAAAVLAAALWAVDDVVRGEQRREPVIEEAEVPGPNPGDRVVVHLVPGSPRSSYALIRW